ncbi:hypothetical protein LY90DRAFT_394587, partial [Neocallimastix californiae]
IKISKILVVLNLKQLLVVVLEEPQEKDQFHQELIMEMVEMLVIIVFCMRDWVNHVTMKLKLEQLQGNTVLFLILTLLMGKDIIVYMDMAEMKVTVVIQVVIMEVILVVLLVILLVILLVVLHQFLIQLDVLVVKIKLVNLLPLCVEEDQNQEDHQDMVLNQIPIV